MADKKRELEELIIDNTVYKTRLNKKYHDRDAYKPADISKVICFIPGTIVEIFVEVGQEVEEGEDLLILEAMKMKNKIKCHASGKVRRIMIEPGQRVAKGDILVVLI